ncbi:MAG TPA: NAD(P)-dependent methylenetetrahydromethanopterin dehydrogenase, partial [Gemmatimonadales bacterium]|nr:NAD(P)-dependent methylenetetrahydromethanopterin dehydrogenase [Gemmatimonadales bacterium]
MRKLLLQLDSSRLPSVFDQVVGFDGGADQIMSYGGVTPEDVRDLIHGCIFTRGAKDLKNTAVWIGGNNMSQGEQLLAMAVDAMFSPLTVSVMLDSNGANTTAAAAVLAARRHVPLAGAIVTVLAGTGAVGRRVVQLLASEGARVRVGSRKLVHAEGTCDKV